MMIGYFVWPRVEGILKIQLIFIGKVKNICLKFQYSIKILNFVHSGGQGAPAPGAKGGSQLTWYDYGTALIVIATKQGSSK